ncbi:DedA family protein [Kineococcus gynurae]|uniref:DedA family protein n=1 Tax=Kineococcus gynurae TaxID=452979 RepID=A0ABV5LPC4_9ACTN
MTLTAALPTLASADLLDPTTLLAQFGGWALWGAAAVVFAECGLLVGFFLPGDSLLFTVGLLQHQGVIPHALWLVTAVLAVAAFAGNVCGYEIGRRIGPALLDRPDSRFLRRRHLDRTIAFFDTHGPRAVVLARFVPVVRTFITVAAGAGRMSRRTFFVYSGVGAVLWAAGITVLGWALGGIELVRENIELGLGLLVVLTLLPVLVARLRRRRRERRGARTTPGGTPDGTPPGAADPGAVVAPRTAADENAHH